MPVYKNSMNFHILCILLIFLSLPIFCLSERCNPNEKKILLQIKQVLNPARFNSWDPKTDCCEDWYGVGCDPNTNRIVTFDLFHANLSNQIPAAIGDLPFLENLVFRKLTNLTGQIQPAIAKLTNLRLLRLSYANLSGPVPTFLSQLKNLYFLDLSFNDLTGSIPPEISLLQNLEALHLDWNNTLVTSQNPLENSLEKYLIFISPQQPHRFGSKIIRRLEFY